MNKKLIWILGALIFVIAGFIIGNTFTTANSQDSIYDDASRIAEQGDSYSYIGRVGQVNDNNTKLSFSLSGMETLWSIKAKDDTALHIEYSSKIDSGKCKLVLIDPAGNINLVFEGSAEGQISHSLNDGEYRLKIVGKSAKGQIDFTLKPSEGVTLKARKN